MPFQRKKPTAIGVKAPVLGFVEPALATSIEKVPSGNRRVHEIKFDGYRVQLHLANEAAKVFTRNGHDWTKRFSKIAHDAFLINAASAIIDRALLNGLGTSAKASLIAGYQRGPVLFRRGPGGGERMEHCGQAEHN
jgi:ATP dependent DNA ligase domain